MIERRLELLWDQLQGKKPHLPHFLSGVHLDGIRGFRNLRVTFDDLVSVIWYFPVATRQGSPRCFSPRQKTASPPFSLWCPP